MSESERSRILTAKAFAREQGLLLTEEGDGLFELRSPITSDPVIGQAEENFRVPLDEVEAHLGI